MATKTTAKTKGETADAAPRTLADRLCAVMEGVSRIPKDGYNSHFRFHYATNEAVSDTVRALLVREGVTFLPRMTDINRNGNKVTIAFTFHFFGSGEELSTTWYGEAVDSSDKGVAKAATAAVKYFLLKTFLISAGDEPDSDAGGEVHQKPKAWVDAFKASHSPPEMLASASDALSEERQAFEAIGGDWDKFLAWAHKECGVPLEELSAKELRSLLLRAHDLKKQQLEKQEK